MGGRDDVGGGQMGITPLALVVRDAARQIGQSLSPPADEHDPSISPRLLCRKTTDGSRT